MTAMAPIAAIIFAIIIKLCHGSKNINDDNNDSGHDENDDIYNDYDGEIEVDKMMMIN